MSMFWGEPLNLIKRYRKNVNINIDTFSDYSVYGESVYSEGVISELGEEKFNSLEEVDILIFEDDLIHSGDWIDWHKERKIIDNRKLLDEEEERKVEIVTPKHYKFLRLSETLFSMMTQKEVFEQLIADWDFEIYEVLQKDKDANLFMINVRNTYGFIMAMWQKSPLGDLLEYVRKIAS
jgi:hypothetical protein